jgi:hypothetical protein
MTNEGLPLAPGPHSAERLIIRGGNRALTVGRHDHRVDPRSVAGGRAKGLRPLSTAHPLAAKCNAYSAQLFGCKKLREY